MRLQYILYITILSFIWTSCEDPIHNEVLSENETRIYFVPLAETRDSGFFSDGDEDGSAEDRAISELRVLIFRETGSLAYNKYTEDLSAPFHINVMTGTYDFVFIANEKSDPNLSSRLNSFNSSLSDIYNLSFASTAFDENRNIPMSHIEKNVQVLGQGKYKLSGEDEKSGTWNVILTRLGIRIDLLLKTKDITKRNVFDGIKIKRLPKTVPIFPFNNSGDEIYNDNVGYVEKLIEKGGGFSPSGDDPEDYEWSKRRIILPSSIFSNKSTEEKSILIEAIYNNSLVAPNSATLGPRITEPVDYTAPRNNYFIFNGRINKEKLEINLIPSAWTQENTNWLLGGRILKVSQTEVSITPLNGIRIHFWSNMPNVRVHNSVYRVISGGEEEFWTNNKFNSLVGSNPARFKYQYDYNTRCGEGYMDILAAENDIQENTVYRLLLLASTDWEATTTALQHEIRINIKTDTKGKFFWWLPTEPRYIGTFHKKNETGERIITGFGMNYRWTAKVIDGEEFIRLSTTPSRDPFVGTSLPSNPEKYPVTDGSTEVAGADRIYFRVGMVDKYMGTDPARYGKILLTVNQMNNNTVIQTNEYPIYVRQGEDPDFLMTEDNPVYDNAGNLVSDTRPSSSLVKFSPYNLTARGFKDGYTNTFFQINRGAAETDLNAPAFVEYPTQSGAHFQSVRSRKLSNYSNYIRRAYNPTLDIVNENDWDNNYITEPPLWGIQDILTPQYAYGNENETCPPGYRRPNDGPINNLANNDSYDEVKKSEIRQSLMKTIPLTSTEISTNQNKHNHMYGYLADGFYDRRPLEDAVGIVAKGTLEVAFSGVLFYNEINNASIFFPGAGTRNHDDRELKYRATGYYWTSSTSGAAGTLAYPMWELITPQNLDNTRFIQNNISHASSIRCIKTNEN